MEAVIFGGGGGGGSGGGSNERSGSDGGRGSDCAGGNGGSSGGGAGSCGVSVEVVPGITVVVVVILYINLSAITVNLFSRIFLSSPPLLLLSPLL